MLASRTVCAQCRFRLLAGAATVRTVRPNSTASFPPAAASAAETISKAKPKPPQAQVPKAPRKVPTKKLKDPRQESARKRALDLFESTVNNQAQAQAQSVSETSQDFSEVCRIAEELDQILKEKGRARSSIEVAAKSYKFITTKLLPVYRRFGDHPPQLIRTKAFEALQRIIETKLDNVTVSELPSVSDVCKLHFELRSLKPTLRLKIVNGFLNAITALRLADSNASGLATRAVNERLLDDLVEFWKHFSCLRRTNSGLGIETSFWLTSRPDMRGTEQPDKLFHLMFPEMKPTELGGLAPALVTTYVLLSDRAYEKTRAREEAGPLLEALETIVKRFDRENLSHLFEDSPELWKFVEPRADWRVTQMAPEAWQELSTPLPGNSYRDPWKEKFSYNHWRNRLVTVFRANDHSATQQAWRDLIDPANDTERAAKLRGCPELLDYVLHLACRKSREAPVVYTQMIKEVLEYINTHEMTPTLRTYTSMMEGWKLSKQLRPIDELWKSLRKSSMKLDDIIWVSWISAQGLLGPEWAGVKALTDMSKMWEWAVREDKRDIAVQPKIAHVNAAISALVLADHMAEVQKVLSWANGKGLKPDIYTYNMLLSKLLKKGSLKEADQILTAMKTGGVTPDGATFTIILEAALDGLSDSSPHEATEAINIVFKEMAACGIEPNQETYGKMLHTVVRTKGDAKQTAINAVLAHLRSKDLQPSAEICTMLVDYYVNREKPDFESVRAIVADRRSRTRALTDRVFWETVVKHYHRAGDLAGALEIVYDLDDWGIWPTLSLLEPLLRSLISRRDWNGAERLVQTVRRQKRPGSTLSEPDARFWKHGFWAVAREYELL